MNVDITLTVRVVAPSITEAARQLETVIQNRADITAYVISIDKAKASDK